MSRTFPNIEEELRQGGERRLDRGWGRIEGLKIEDDEECEREQSVDDDRWQKCHLGFYQLSAGII